MGWWRRSKRSDKREAADEVFHWSDASETAFLKTFQQSRDTGMATRDMTFLLSSRRVELSSWDLRREDQYFAWASGSEDPRAARLPASVTVSQSREAYAERSSRDWTKLSTLGFVTVWRRGGDNSTEPHGFELRLALDPKRYRAVRGALRRHAAGAPPVLTVAMALDSRNHNEAGRLRDFPVLAYWLTTWPMSVGKLGAHPWARGLLVESLMW